MSTNDLRTTTRRMLAFVRPHWRGLIGALLAFIAAAATEPLLPWLLQITLDSGFGAPRASALGPQLPSLNLPKPSEPFPIWMVPVVLIGLFAARGLFSFLGQYLLQWTVGRTVLDIRCALMNALMRADASNFTQMAGGTAVTKLVGDPQQAVHLVSNAGLTLLRDGLPALAMLGYLLYTNWKLTLLTLVTLPVMALVLKQVNKRVRRVGGQAYEAQMALSNAVDDATRAWKLVRSFGAQEHERERFSTRAQNLRRQTLKQVAANSMAQPLSQLIASVGLSLIVALAILQGRQQGGTPGEFLAFVSALLLLMSRARHLAEMMQPWTNGLIIARGAMELLDLPPEDDRGTVTQHSGPGALRLHDIRLQYPGSEAPALNGLSLEIAAGQTVALVGASGAGKSSVVHLLLGFARAQGGRYEIDGLDSTTLSLAALRSQFAVVSQDTLLFDDTVLANVAYAQTPDRARAESALRDAALWDFVQALPQGMDTRIGSNGSTLSGGQRQRLAIARALYRDAPIWIFDEATSALDTESERAVQDALARHQGHKTVILIAHRLSTVRHADRIFVLQAGRVVESGNHAELLAAGGTYAALVSLGEG
ncbi:subfamily B ATP-binding cassette protein MsbA [Inhella inkyongensis]|uniref:Subfamily B ATP-binding cassette protein MsbA n=1 Tax=Inhella inkyongensis TaxID=392593 RepID=A0A840S1F5_9BURK|nr:ABC transporter transmembrane domain-containing protein [Inhella inkyongensis]MBB5204115.1 subfamily B ATP-binding cassette protein MsbA [Inhella inkyongensis]